MIDLCAGWADAERDARALHSSGDLCPWQRHLPAGRKSNELFIVASGRASARLQQSSGGDIRLATFAPGTFFGELAILDAGPRSATLIADDDVNVTCYRGKDSLRS